MSTWGLMSTKMTNVYLGGCLNHAVTDVFQHWYMPLSILYLHEKFQLYRLLIKIMVAQSIDPIYLTLSKIFKVTKGHQVDLGLLTFDD